MDKGTSFISHFNERSGKFWLTVVVEGEYILKPNTGRPRLIENKGLSSYNFMLIDRGWTVVAMPRGMVINDQ